jgi:hypothetical protein
LIQGDKVIGVLVDISWGPKRLSTSVQNLLDLRAGRVSIISPTACFVVTAPRYLLGAN